MKLSYSTMVAAISAVFLSSCGNAGSSVFVYSRDTDPITDVTKTSAIATIPSPQDPSVYGQFRFTCSNGNLFFEAVAYGPKTANEGRSGISISPVTTVIGDEVRIVAIRLDRNEPYRVSCGEVDRVLKNELCKYSNSVGTELTEITNSLRPKSDYPPPGENGFATNLDRSRFDRDHPVKAWPYKRALVRFSTDTGGGQVEHTFEFPADNPMILRTVEDCGWTRTPYKARPVIAAPSAAIEATAAPVVGTENGAGDAAPDSAAASEPVIAEEGNADQYYDLLQYALGRSTSNEDILRGIRRMQDADELDRNCDDSGDPATFSAEMRAKCELQFQAFTSIEADLLVCKENHPTEAWMTCKDWEAENQSRD
jgi:hypothetical protein